MSTELNDKIKLSEGVSKVLQIHERRPFTLELYSVLLANHLNMFDAALGEFLELNPKTPLKDGKIVFENPGSLLVFNVSPEIKGLYNKVCALITRAYYSQRRLNMKAYSFTRRRYYYWLLNSIRKEGALEICEFHTQHCKLIFSIRLD